MPDYTCNATITYREDLSDELCIVHIRPDSGEIPEFVPGQYAELAIPDAPDETQPKKKLIRRAYSIANPPRIRDYLEFYVVLVPDGYFTPKLWELREGDPIWLGPKIKGKFTLDPAPPGKDLVMVSTGTGIAPFVAMLHEYQHTDRWRRFIIIHGTRMAIDLGYRETLEKIAAEDPTVVYIPTVTREPESTGWAGPRGRVNTIFENGTYEQYVGNSLTSEECHVFLCGNPDMIDTVQALLEQKGLRPHSKKNPGNIHFERYW